MMIGEKDIKDT